MTSEKSIPDQQDLPSTTSFSITLLPPPPWPLLMMLVAVKPLASEPSAQPSRPPTRASSSDSRKNDIRICQRAKPRMRSTPMSLVRWLMAANMVFMTPNTPPIAMMTATKQMAYEELLVGGVQLVVIFRLGLGRHGRAS